MKGALEWCWHLALVKEDSLNPESPAFNPEHPEWKMESLALGDSLTEVRDSAGRLVFVDDDGHCFVHSGSGEWIEVEANITVTVTPKKAPTKGESP